MTLHLKLSIFFLLVLSSQCISAPNPYRRSDTSIGSSIASRNITVRADDIDTVHYFKQRVNHDSRLSGKFKQRYWVNAQHYRPSGPIFLVIGGSDLAATEDPVSAIKDGGLIEMFAKGVAGACVVLEHRYFGKSLPYKDLSEKHLQVLTIQQSIEDLAYFAQKVKLPAPIGYAHPDTNPWVIVGSGYAGTLANWAMLKHPDIFFVGYASSAPAKAQEDLWKYWDAVRVAMAKEDLNECSAAIESVSEYIDHVAAKNNKKLEASLKKLLRLDGVTELVDVAEAVAYSVKMWDARRPGKVTKFDKFCQVIGDHARKKIENLLIAWGEWNKEIFEGENDDAFWGTYDSNHERFTDNNAGRPWFWLQCNELGWFRTAAPKNTHSLLPRLLDIDNERRICSMHFPKNFPQNEELKAPRIEETNAEFQTVQANGLLATVGEFEAWRVSGISFPSLKEPGPFMVIDKGFIGSDMYKNRKWSQDQKIVQEIIGRWILKWQPKKSSSAFKAWMKKVKEKFKAGRG